MECDIPAALTVTAEPRDERHYMNIYDLALYYYIYSYWARRL